MSRKTTEPTTQARRTSGGEHLYRSPSRSTYCDQMSTVYVLRAKGTNMVKIGFTAGDVEERRRALQTGCPHELVVELTFAGTMEDERRAHMIHRERRGVGEWFDLAEEQVRLIPGIIRRRLEDEAFNRYQANLADLRKRFEKAFGSGHGSHRSVGAYSRDSVLLFCETVSESSTDSRLNGYSSMCLDCGADPTEYDYWAERGESPVGAEDSDWTQEEWAEYSANLGHARGCHVPWLARAAAEIRKARG